MVCPRCGHEQGDSPACERCGVVFARLRPESQRRRPAAAAAPEPRPAGVGGFGAAALAVAIVGGLVLLREARRTATVPDVAVTPGVTAGEIAQAAPGGPADAPPEPPAIAIAPPPVAAAAAGLDPADRLRADRLAALVNERGRVTQASLDEAEGLYLRYPNEPALGGLLEAVLLARASEELQAEQPARSLPLLRRAQELNPGSLPALRGRLAAHLTLADWSDAETVARDLIARVPGDPDGVYGLGFALMRQDRGREAVEVLQASQEERARTLIARVQKGLRDEGRMVEQRLSHFNVRWDGEEHTDVGREVLRALERHYATLVQTFGHEPRTALPVILFSRTAYHQASGAPAWSGGVYDGLDGKIRVPVGGLTTSLSPDMDETLVHELTHAFMWDMSRGQAPRELHEGMAQYMEGRRIGALPAEHVQALADGRVRGVPGFYLMALVFTEHLVAQRGQGGVNEALRAMGSGSTVDDAFQQVYGKGMAELQREAAARLQQRYGS